MLRYICSVGLCKCSLNIFCFIGLFKKLHILKYAKHSSYDRHKKCQLNECKATRTASNSYGARTTEIGNLTIYKSNTMFFELQCNVWLKLNKKMPANSIHSGFGLFLFHFLLFIFLVKNSFQRTN